jgi:hypothetical protein
MRSILTKFYNFLKLPSILNKFQKLSAPSLLPRILLQIPFWIRERWNSQRCSTFQTLHPSILFQKFGAREGNLWIKSIRAHFWNSNSNSNFGPGPPVILTPSLHSTRWPIHQPLTHIVPSTAWSHLVVTPISSWPHLSDAG